MTFDLDVFEFDFDAFQIRSDIRQSESVCSAWGNGALSEISYSRPLNSNLDLKLNLNEPKAECKIEFEIYCDIE